MQVAGLHEEWWVFRNGTSHFLHAFQLQSCSTDSSWQSTIPDLPERFHFKWNPCKFVSDNAEYFYKHVHQHANDYPKGPKLQVPEKCMSEGCESVFRNKHHLIEHLRSHTQDETVAYPTCENFFSSTINFVDHLHRQVNLKDQSFQCSHCEKKLLTEWMLKKHIHSHVNNFKCPQCQMTTCAPSKLCQY